MTPRVAVCIAAHRAERWIGEAVGSALDQTLCDVEVVVVDDGSPDGTADAVRALADPRVRLVSTPNRGQAAALNLAVASSSALLVKPLGADDVLLPHCLARLVAVAERTPTVGLVFAPRRLLVESGAEAWAGRYGAVHEGFGPLEEVNDGRALLDRWLAAGLRENWVGEPSSVLLRRDAFERAGGFNPHVCGPVDLDLWPRVLAVADAGFVPDELTLYRVHAASLTARLHGRRRVSLDRAWLLHGLAAMPELRERRAELLSLRRETELRTAKDAVRARRLPRGLPAYLGARLRR